MHKLKLIPKVLQHISESTNTAFKEKMNYPEFVDALFNEKSSPLESLVHCGLGVAGEAGEFADCIKKAWAYNDDIETLDQKNFIEELGDLAFYMQKALNMAGLSWEHIQAVNYTKLSKRYPDAKFTSQHAKDRLDKQEEQSDMFEENLANVPPQQPPQAPPQPVAPILPRAPQPPPQGPRAPQPAPIPESSELGGNDYIKNGYVLRSLEPHKFYDVLADGIRFNGKFVSVNIEEGEVIIHLFGDTPFNVAASSNLKISKTLDGSFLIIAKVKDIKKMSLSVVTQYDSNAIPQDLLKDSSIKGYIELIGGVGANCLLVSYGLNTDVLHTRMKIGMDDVLHRHSIASNFSSGDITFGCNTGGDYVDVFFNTSTITRVTIRNDEENNNV